MDFNFTINTGRSILVFNCQVVHETTESQTVRVTLGDRSMEFENDLPYNARMNLKRGLRWRRLSGKVGNIDVYLEMIDLL